VAARLHLGYVECTITGEKTDRWPKWGNPALPRAAMLTVCREGREGQSYVGEDSLNRKTLHSITLRPTITPPMQPNLVLALNTFGPKLRRVRPILPNPPAINCL